MSPFRWRAVVSPASIITPYSALVNCGLHGESLDLTSNVARDTMCSMHWMQATVFMLQVGLGGRVTNEETYYEVFTL